MYETAQHPLRHVFVEDAECLANAHNWRCHTSYAGLGFPVLTLSKQGQVVFADIPSKSGELNPVQQGWKTSLTACPAVGYFLLPEQWEAFERYLTGEAAGLNDWARLCDAWFKTHQQKPRTAYDILLLAKGLNCLAEHWQGRSTLPATQRMGKALSKRVGTRCGDFIIRKSNKLGYSRSLTYRLEPVSA